MASAAQPLMYPDLVSNPSFNQSMREYGPQPQPKISADQLKHLSTLLETAVQTGEVDKACKLAEQLAREKVKISIELDAQAYENRMKEQSFSLKVIIEDRQSTGTSIYLTVKSSDTISDLKKRMMLIYNVPMEVQKWIISMRVCEDKKTLHHCQVKGHGCTAYLYLITAKSVNLDKNTYETTRENIATGRIERPPEVYESVYMTMENPQLVTPSASIIENSTQLQQDTGQRTGGQSPRNSGLLTTAVGAPASRPSSTLLTAAPPPPPQSPLPPPFPSLLPAAPAPPLLPPGPPAAKQTKKTEKQIGWECPGCTFMNMPLRPGCEICSTDRPVDYQIPEGYVPSEREQRLMAQSLEADRLVQEAENERQRRAMELSMQNFMQILEVDDQDLIPNTEEFDCPICFSKIAPGEGVMLRECLHMFCRECLMSAVKYNEEAGLKCPFQDEVYVCNAMLQDREVRALVDPEMYDRYLKRSLDLAESQAENSYHCKSADCPGWCIYEDLVNFFTCPICQKENCLTCKAIHEGLNCKQYQEDLKLRALNDEAAKQTQEMLEKMLQEGNAMHCPKCKIIVQKKDGCDWIRCSICKTEICWVTKGPRWGPNGEGDTSAGCKCRVNGAKCHPQCNNCH